MRRYAYDVSAVQQHPLEIFGAHREGERFANQGLTRGTVNGFAVRLQLTPLSPDLVTLRSEGQEWLEGMPTATYRTWEEGRAVLGVAWWVLRDGAVCYRVAGELLTGKTCKDLRQAVRPWGISNNRLHGIHPAALVWPDLWIDSPRRKCHPILAAMRRELADRPLQPAAWAEMADWCEESGDDAGRIHAHGALAVLAQLAPHLE